MPEAQAVRAYPAERWRALAAIQEAFRACGFRLVDADVELGLFRGRTRVSLMTWGERVRVVVAGTGPDTCRVFMESASTSGLLDWGRNARHVRRFFDALDRQLARRLYVTPTVRPVPPRPASRRGPF